MSVVGIFKTRARRPCLIARLANKPGCYPWQVRGADPQAELELFICDRSDPRRLSPDIPSCIITCLVYEGKLRRISRKHRLRAFVDTERCREINKRATFPNTARGLLAGRPRRHLTRPRPSRPPSGPAPYKPGSVRTARCRHTPA